MKYVQDRFLTGLVDACTDEKATRRGAGRGYCSAFNSSFVSSFCYSSENMSLRDPNQSWASSLWDHRDTCIETLTARVLTLHAQQIENHINTSRQAAIVWQPAYNQANLSQVTEFILINRKITMLMLQNSSIVKVALEKRSFIIQLKFNVDSIRFNNSVSVANLVSLSGSIQFTFEG